MWAGDVQSGYPTQWALNPSTYQNLPNEQVDWASLAQQWIKMKETFPEPQSQVPPAPPPPSIQADIEAGEAPMDVTKDEVAPAPAPTSSSNPPPPQDGSWGTWGNWQQWGWGWGGPPDSYTAPPAPPATTFDYNHGHGGPVPDNFDQGQQGYWSEGPAPFVRNKPAPSDWRSERGPSRRQSGKVVEEVPEPDTTALFDAAKRKQLPAWIREGLEKMEREKQKKLERERQLKEREEEMLRRKQEEEEALASGVPLKSKFDTDSEDSEKEAEPEVVMKPRKSRFDTASSPVHSKPTNSYSPPPVKRKSREEIMQEVMQQTRYVLTDILMTVTNEEMRKIAEEVLADFRAKAPASRLRQTPALTSLTGKLGLGIYDSDSEDSSGESDDEPSSKQNGADSDEELRERISRKKQEFARIERDIEHQVEQQEERDRERQMEEEEEEEEERQERGKEMGQVEPKLLHSGNRVDIKTEDLKVNPEPKYEQNHLQSFTPERLHKEKESSVDKSEDSNSSSKSESSSSRSSSSSRHRKSKKSKRKKEKKSSKKKRKRSRSRSSDRRKSHKKSSHSHRYERERSRSRSRSRGHHDDYYHYRRHSSESSHKRRHHSYSRSPDHSRGKRSSHRSRD